MENQFGINFTEIVTSKATSQDFTLCQYTRNYFLKAYAPAS